MTRTASPVHSQTNTENQGKQSRMPTRKWRFWSSDSTLVVQGLFRPLNLMVVFIRVDPLSPTRLYMRACLAERGHALVVIVTDTPIDSECLSVSEWETSVWKGRKCLASKTPLPSPSLPTHSPHPQNKGTINKHNYFKPKLEQSNTIPTPPLRQLLVFSPIPLTFLGVPISDSIRVTLRMWSVRICSGFHVKWQFVR